VSRPGQHPETGRIGDGAEEVDGVRGHQPKVTADGEGVDEGAVLVVLPDVPSGQDDLAAATVAQADRVQQQAPVRVVRQVGSLRDRQLPARRQIEAGGGSGDQHQGGLVAVGELDRVGAHVPVQIGRTQLTGGDHPGGGAAVTGLEIVVPHHLGPVPPGRTDHQIGAPVPVEVVQRRSAGDAGKGRHRASRRRRRGRGPSAAGQSTQDHHEGQ